jgi:hypothetical protein
MIIVGLLHLKSLKSILNRYKELKDLELTKNISLNSRSYCNRTK